MMKPRIPTLGGAPAVSTGSADPLSLSGRVLGIAELGDERPLAAQLIAANLAYPFVLALFFAALGPAAAGSRAALAGAAMALALAFAIPAIGLVAIRRLGALSSISKAALRARRLAHLTVAVPPLFTATGVVLITIDLPAWETFIWLAMWLIALAALVIRPARAEPPGPVLLAPPAAWLRWSHGVAAAAVLIGFVGLHLGNHLFALAGADAHGAVQETLRQWYRAPAIEPILIALVAWLLGSGAALARHRTATASDGWGALQTASGAYLGAFLFSHLTAALLMARAKFGIDTDWAWASGAPVGLLGDPWSVRLIPHYALAVTAVAVHAACGLRQVLLAHKMRRATANALGHLTIGGGVLLALTLVAALLGLRL